ncbi:MAG TPA: hypothetical protein EYP14_15600, partial [Planctomycetaceae bacterium]|nr:hypothetical protein [Planctomycetaceae bacterium]
MNGSVELLRQPLSVQLTSAATEEDFPAATVGPDGKLWLVYIKHERGTPITLPADGSIPKDWSSLVTKDNGDQVLLMCYDGQRWSEPVAVTPRRLDLWRPSVAVYGGKVVVAWSQNFDGEWDLCLRSYEPASGRWSERRRVERAGADIHVQLVASPDGSNAWLIWQGWTEANFDILAQNIEQLGRTDPIQLTSTPANEWTPAAAVDRNGTLYVVYDSYRNGNYDVYLNIGLNETVAVAATPRFEARPHLAVDERGRVWIAYEEGDPNWGKDFGTRWPGRTGAPFYLYRTIAVRVWSGGKLLEPLESVPVDPVNTRFGDGKRRRASLPRLAFDRAGRLWLTYRRHALLTGVGTVWASFATYYSGGRWSAVIP